MTTKKVYELNFRTNYSSSFQHVIFGSKKRAEKALKSVYSVGSIWITDEIIEQSYISIRTLF